MKFESVESVPKSLLNQVGPTFLLKMMFNCSNTILQIISISASLLLNLRRYRVSRPRRSRNTQVCTVMKNSFFIT